jgi:signal transduction histidine kinase
MSSEAGDIRIWRGRPWSASIDGIGGTCPVIASDVGVAEPGRAGEGTAPDGLGRQLGRRGRSARIRTAMLAIVGRLLAGVRLTGREQASGFILLATAGVAAFSLGRPLDALYAIATSPLEKGRTVYAVVALACYLPLQVWLVLSAARDARGRRQAWALAAMAAVIIGMLPVVGIQWVGTLYVLAALVLVTVRRRWSFLLYGVLVAAPTPLTFAFGQPEWALYFTTGMLWFSMPVAVGIWLVRAARQLQAARLALAKEAVVRERLRIDGELRETVGARLEEIATCGERAAGLVASHPSASAQQLRGLAGRARRTLAEARRMVTRYREVSLRAELETAATLLSAAGIDVRLELPPGELPATVDAGERAALRREIARLLGETARASVTIAVTCLDGRARFELRPRADAVRAGMAVG